MYTHCTHQTVKYKVLSQFTSSSSLRLVIATVVFSVRTDCLDVYQVIHWGVPEDAEMYVQETEELVEMDYQHVHRCSLLELRSGVSRGFTYVSRAPKGQK